MSATDAHAIYDQIAAQYDALVDQSAHNAHYERPAMLRLMEAAGKRVLDVGCGNGFYLERLLQAGAANAVGIDYSSKMVEIARRRLGSSATVHLADLREPLDVVKGALFDLVIGPLVFHYFENWDAPLKEIHSLLQHDGRVVLSVGHPFADMRSSTSHNYFEVELVREQWPSFGVTMPTFRRSLTSMFKTFEASGFVVESLVEPEPDELLEATRPELCREFRECPHFICLRLRKA